MILPMMFRTIRAPFIRLWRWLKILTVLRTFRQRNTKDHSWLGKSVVVSTPDDSKFIGTITKIDGSTIIYITPRENRNTL